MACGKNGSLKKSFFGTSLKGSRKMKNQKSSSLNKNGSESHFWNHFWSVFHFCNFSGSLGTFEGSHERTTSEPKMVLSFL